jgi:D-inositol-3-phosphate glycosyltransferase
MIFGTFLWHLPDALTTGSTEKLYGAHVAMMGFLRALLAHGLFDGYHFFVSASNPEAAKQDLEKFLRGISNEAYIEVRDILELEYALTEKNFTVFHGSTPSLRQLAYARSQFGVKLFPITARIDSISYQRFLPEILLTLLESDLYPFDSIICTSSAAKDACEKLFEQVSRELFLKHSLQIRYPGRFDLIPLGVDTETFRPRDKRDARKLLSLPQNKLVLLCFGRFSAHDKMDLLPLLKGFKRVLEECQEQASDLLLLLAGEDERSHYAQLVEYFVKLLKIEDHVRVLKNPSFIEQPLIYSAADIFVSFADNFQESFGITVLEAMASGVPAIVSDWDGYKDTVIHGKTGFRVPTYWADCEEKISLFSPICDFGFEHFFLAQSVCVDANKIVEYLTKVILHPELREELGRNARNLAVERFDWRVIIRQYEELWKDLYRRSQDFEPPPRKTPMFRPNRLKAFSSYPSRMIQAETLIHTTADGSEALLRKEIFPLYKGMETMFPIIQDIIGLAQEDQRVGHMEQELLEKYQEYAITPQDVKYLIMRMLKHGWLEVMSGY